MAEKSLIEWTDSTWNPVTGCTKVSPGCKNCYAERLALRLQAAKNPSYEKGFQVNIHEHLLNLPLTWRKPKQIFVNSMSDLFHEDISEEFILRVFNIMNQAYWHRFQVLTKRSERLFELNNKLPWSANIWMGVSVENSDYIFRVEHLRSTGARVKFLSLEPLLGPISSIDLSGIDWVIVGGESGPKARPMELSWVNSLLNDCQELQVPFFFKQWGGVNKKKAGRVLNGKLWYQLPLALDIVKPEGSLI